MQDWGLPKALLGVFWKRDRWKKGLREAGWFISERAGGKDRRKTTTGQLEVLFQQTSGVFNEVIKATCGQRKKERERERLREGGIISLSQRAKERRQAP